jgi:hypothetical protein
MRKPLFIAAVFSITLSTPALSQDYGLGGMDSFISTSNSNMMMTNTIISNQSFRSSLKNKLNSRKTKATPSTSQTSKSTARASTVKAFPAVALTYKPSAAIRQRSKEQFFAKMRSIDPESARKLEAHFATRDLFQALDQEIAKYGMRTDNVADAFTVWLINLWMGANGISNDPPVSRIKAVKAQITDSLRMSSDIAGASDTQKQELTESLLLNASVIGAALADPRVKSGEMRAPLQKAMVRLGSSIGLNLAAMKLTDTGFVL